MGLLFKQIVTSLDYRVAKKNITIQIKIGFILQSKQTRHQHFSIYRALAFYFPV